MPRLRLLARLPRLDDPSQPSLAPRTAEPLPPIVPTLHPTLARAPPETHRSPNPQTTTNMLSLIPKMGNRTVGCAKRPLFPAESGNKLISDSNQRCYGVSGGVTGGLWRYEQAEAGEVAGSASVSFGESAMTHGSPNLGFASYAIGNSQAPPPKKPSVADSRPFERILLQSATASSKLPA